MAPAERPSSAGRDASPDADFVTVAEFKELEKANLTAALTRTNWKTWGPEGAAELLGMKPSTLTYRMKALGITKPHAER